MNKPIRNYDDLLAEQQRLVSVLKTHEAKVKVDIAGVKEGMQPMTKAFGVINKLGTRDNTAPVMNFGLEMGIDLVIRRILLSRAGWFTKIVVPFLIKNYSSHLIGEEKRDALMDRVKGFFNKIRMGAAPQNDPSRSSPRSREAAGYAKSPTTTHDSSRPQKPSTHDTRSESDKRS